VVGCAFRGVSPPIDNQLVPSWGLRPPARNPRLAVARQPFRRIGVALRAPVCFGTPVCGTVAHAGPSGSWMSSGVLSCRAERVWTCAAAFGSLGAGLQSSSGGRSSCELGAECSCVFRNVSRCTRHWTVSPALRCVGAGSFASNAIEATWRFKLCSRSPLGGEGPPLRRRAGAIRRRSLRATMSGSSGCRRSETGVDPRVSNGRRPRTSRGSLRRPSGRIRRVLAGRRRTGEPAALAARLTSVSRTADVGLIRERSRPRAGQRATVSAADGVPLVGSRWMSGSPGKLGAATSGPLRVAALGRRFGHSRRRVRR